MSSLRPKLPIIIPLLIGISLLLALHKWEPLIKLEHSTFLFPERFEPDSIFPDHGQLTDFQVTTLNFAPSNSPRTLGTYIVDDKTRDIIDLTPEKWAYFLETIRTNSNGLLVITPPLSWSDATELAIQTLDHQISQTPDIVIGLNAEFNNTASPLPPFLANSVISKKTSFLNLPRIDFLTHPPSIKAPLFGISTIQGLPIETAANGIKVPLLVQWAESILPTTHLAALLAAHRLTPRDLIITPGYLRLGTSGSILKIDHQGRTIFPSSGNETSSADQLLIYPEQATPSKILLAPNSPQPLTLLETHLTQALSQTPTVQKTYQRWPLPVEIAILIILTLVLQTRRLWIIIPSIIATFAVSLNLSHWLLITPTTVLLLSFILLPKPSSKKSPPPESKENETETPKPTPPPVKKQPPKRPQNKPQKRPQKKQLASAPACRKKKKRR